MNNCYSSNTNMRYLSSTTILIIILFCTQQTSGFWRRRRRNPAPPPAPVCTVTDNFNRNPNGLQTGGFGVCSREQTYTQLYCATCTDGRGTCQFHRTAKYNYLYCCKGRQKQNSDDKTCLSSIPCTQPPNVVNGYYLPLRLNYAVGHSVVYSCAKYYETKGTNTITCKLGPFWEGKPPLCVQKTCKPPQIKKSVLVLNKKTSYKLNERIYFSCAAHHIFDAGQSVHECKNPPQWTGSTYVCRDTRIKITTVKTPQTPCNPPPVLAHGKYDPVKTSYPVDESVQYKCDQYYALVGQKIFRTCTMGTPPTWDGRTGFCVELRCPKPRKTASNVLLSSNKDSFRRNEMVYFSCIKSHIYHVGDSEHICEHPPYWKGQPYVCQKKENALTSVSESPKAEAHIIKSAPSTGGHHLEWKIFAWANCCFVYNLLFLRLY